MADEKQPQTPVVVRIETDQERREREHAEKQKQRRELLAQVLGYGATAGPGVAFPGGAETLEEFLKGRKAAAKE